MATLRTSLSVAILYLSPCEVTEEAEEACSESKEYCTKNCFKIHLQLDEDEVKMFSCGMWHSDAPQQEKNASSHR